MDINRMRDSDSRLDRRLNRRNSNNTDRVPRVTGMKRTSKRGRKGKESTPDSFDYVAVDPTDSDVSTEPDLYLFLKSIKSLGDITIDDDVDGGGNDDEVEYKALEDADDDVDDAECKSADDDEDEGDFDQDYVMCLKNLREFGTAYILAVTGNDGRSVCVKYEEDDEYCDDHKRKSSKKVDVIEVPSKSEEKVKGLAKTHWRKSRSEEKNDSPPMQRQPPARDPKVPSRRGGKNKVIEKEVKVEYMDTAVPKAHNLSQHITKHDKQVFMEDQQYTYFLNCLKQDGDSLLFKTEYGDQIRYESDEESASDSDIEIVGAQYLEARCTPFVLSNGSRFINCDKSSKRTRSEFMEKLMDILAKPFDRYEYDELMHEISERKPLEKHIDLRNNSTKRCILLESVGKSYLDYHADFKRRIEAVRSDRHKGLNLLRGFFYWLKNLSNNDAFKPWLDETCLKVLPGR